MKSLTISCVTVRQNFQAPQFVSLGFPKWHNNYQHLHLCLSPTRLEGNNLLEIVLSSLEVFVYVDFLEIGVNRGITSLFVSIIKTANLPSQNWLYAEKTGESLQQAMSPAETPLVSSPPQVGGSLTVAALLGHSRGSLRNLNYSRQTSFVFTCYLPQRKCYGCEHPTLSPDLTRSPQADTACPAARKQFATGKAKRQGNSS